MTHKPGRSIWIKALFAVLLTALAGSAVLAGCGGSSGTGEQEAVRQEYGNSGDTYSTGQPQNTPPPAGRGEKSFYGQWAVSRVLAYGPVGNYGKDDAESLLGKSLTFSADEAGCFGDQASDMDRVAVNPEFRETEISKNDFAADYRVTFERLGIETDSVLKITAADSQGNGCSFLVVDDGTLVIIGGGTYFELLRKY